jgi:hypothetical protein
MNINIHFWSHLAQFFLELEKLQANVLGYIKTHVLDSIMFVRKSNRVWDTAGKYLQPDTGERMALGLWTLDTYGYKHTLRICKRNTFPLKQYLELDRPQMTVWRMRFSCWKHKATNTHSKYVKHIGFPLKQRLHKRTSVLRYTDIPCLVKIMIISSVKNLCLQ